MAGMNLAFFAVLLLAFVVRARAKGFRAWLTDAPLVFLAAWLAEDTTMRAYDFYAYSPKWELFLDRTPVMVPLTWVFVVLSARDMARALSPRHVVPLGYVIILFDAALVEPICTHAGLWTWHASGPFAVPFIGLFGWTFFGGSLLLFMERLRGWARPLVVVAGPLLMHALLITSWGAFLQRAALRPSNELLFTVAVTSACAAVAAVAIFSDRVAMVPLPLVAPRLVTAAVVFALLYVDGGSPTLWTYALGFALPWVVVTRWEARPDYRAAQVPSH